MYQDRVTAFIDILGFGSLVEKSTNNTDLQKSIKAALESVSPKTIAEKDFVRINESVIPPEKLDEVKALAALFTQAVRGQHEVAVSYFSDCITISALVEDVLASQMVLDLACKLSIRIWSDHRLTLRGGITQGLLYHVDGGQIFGPAMNRAYYLESKLAIYPRIIIDDSCLKHLQRERTFFPLQSLFDIDRDGLTHLSLATAYHHTLTSSIWTLGADDHYTECFKEFQNLPKELQLILDSCDSDHLRQKYNWLIDDCTRAITKTPRRV